MSTTLGMDRRAFLRNAGMAALAGAAGAGTARAGTATETLPQASAASPSGVFDFDSPCSRIGSNCVKWDRQIERFGKGSIEVGMGIADMDFHAAPCIGRALAERCQHDNWGYLGSTKSYVDAIVAWNQKRHRLDVDPDTIVLCDGVHPGVIAALKTFSPPGSHVLLTTPTYNGFYGDLRASFTLPMDSPMTHVNGQYAIDFDDLKSRIGPDTHTLLLCNPQNPTGNCWSPDDLLKLGRLCLERRVVVLSDEIFSDLAMPGHTYTPFASLPDKDVVNNSVSFRAISKTFSISAMKTAYFFSTNRAFLERIQPNHRADVNTLGVVASEAAYREGEPWLDQVLPYFGANHEFVESYLRERLPLIKYTKAQGTYLAWIDVSALMAKIGADERAAVETRKQEPSLAPVTPEAVLERWLVEHAKVHMNTGLSYGTGGAGHMRMNLGTSRRLIAKALDNIAAAVAAI